MADELKLPASMKTPAGGASEVIPRASGALILPESMGGPKSTRAATAPSATPNSYERNEDPFSDAVGRGIFGSGASMLGGAMELIPTETTRKYGGQVADWGKRELAQAENLSPTGSFIGQALPYAVGGGPALGAKSVLGAIGKGAGIGGLLGLTTTPSSTEALAAGPQAVIEERLRPAAIGTVVGGLGGSIPGLAKWGSKAVEGLRPTTALKKVAEDIGINKLGQDLKDKLTNTLTPKLEARRVGATQDYQQFYTAGAPVESQIAGTLRQDLSNYLAQKGPNLLSNDKAFLKKQLTELEPGNLGIEGLDNLQRSLAESAFSGEHTGFGAIRKDLAKELRDIVKYRIDSIVPGNAAAKAWNSYKVASEEINAFNSIVGKAGTETTGGGLLPKVATVRPEGLPSKVFQDKTSVEDFIKLTNDPAFVKDYAQKYAVNTIMPKLEKSSAGGPAAIEDFMIKNKDWIDLVPGFRQDLEKFAATVEAGAKARKLAGYAAKGAGILGPAALGYQIIK